MAVELIILQSLVPPMIIIIIDKCASSMMFCKLGATNRFELPCTTKRFLCNWFRCCRWLFAIACNLQIAHINPNRDESPLRSLAVCTYGDFWLIHKEPNEELLLLVIERAHKSKTSNALVCLTHQLAHQWRMEMRRRWRIRWDECREKNAKKIKRMGNSRAFLYGN